MTEDEGIRKEAYLLEIAQKLAPAIPLKESNSDETDEGRVRERTSGSVRSVQQEHYRALALQILKDQERENGHARERGDGNERQRLLRNRGRDLELER